MTTDVEDTPTDGLKRAAIKAWDAGADILGNAWTKRALCIPTGMFVLTWAGSAIVDDTVPDLLDDVSISQLYADKATPEAEGRTDHCYYLSDRAQNVVLKVSPRNNFLNALTVGSFGIIGDLKPPQYFELGTLPLFKQAECGVLKPGTVIPASETLQQAHEALNTFKTGVLTNMPDTEYEGFLKYEDVPAPAGTG